MTMKPRSISPRSSVLQMDLRVILFLFSALLTGKLFVLKFQDFFLVQHSNILAIYLLGIVTALVGWFVLQRPKGNERGFFFTVLIGSLLTILAVWLTQLHVRQTQPYPQARNDGLVQSEAAAAFMLHGQNPYTANYRQTKFSFFYNPTKPNGDDVASTHYAYPPLVPLLFVPGAWLNEHTTIAVDNESLYLFFFLAMTGVLLFSAATWKNRTWIVLILLANPMSWSFPVSGYNDIVFIFFLVATTLLLFSRRWVWAGAMYGLALASKQTAWLSLPFFGLLLWPAVQQGLINRKGAIRFSLATMLTATVLFFPFFLWSPVGLFDDLVKYVGGAIPWSFPLSGVTFLQYIHIFGLVPSAWTVFPSWPIQLVLFTLIIFFLGRHLRKNPHPATVLACTSIAIIVAALFSRFGAENYYVSGIQVAIAAWVFSDRLFGQQQKAFTSPDD